MIRSFLLAAAFRWGFALLATWASCYPLPVAALGGVGDCGLGEQCGGGSVTKRIDFLGDETSSVTGVVQTYTPVPGQIALLFYLEPRSNGHILVYDPDEVTGQTDINAESFVVTPGSVIRIETTQTLRVRNPSAINVWFRVFREMSR